MLPTKKLQETCQNACRVVHCGCICQPWRECSALAEVRQPPLGLRGHYWPAEPALGPKPCLAARYLQQDHLLLLCVLCNCGESMAWAVVPSGAASPRFFLDCTLARCHES